MAQTLKLARLSRSRLSIGVGLASKKPIYHSDGTEFWHVGYLKTDISSCLNSNFSLSPFNFEFCSLVRNNISFPQKVLVQGVATGAFVSEYGHFLTAHHVVMGCIRQHGLNQGKTSSPPVLCRQLEIEVFDFMDHLGKIHYKSVGHPSLLANSAKSETWIPNSSPQGPFMGLDGAILKTSFQSINYTRIAPNPIVSGQQLWMLGFPLRSKRPPESLKKFKYADADMTLRVAEGVFIGKNGQHTFTSSLDGGPGNSGSPNFNQDGDIVGILSSVVGNARKVFTQYGDFFPQHVFVHSICSRFDIKNLFPSIEGCP